MRRIILAMTLAAAGLSGACGIAGQRPEGFEKRDYVVDPSLKFRPVPLNEIVRNPQEGSAVEFEAMLNRRDESIWQAYYTPFRPGDFKSFSVWPADAAVWDVRGRARSIATLYVAADTPEIAELYSIGQYTPVRIRGVVKSTFDSRPWIQVHYVDEMDSPWFSDESLGHLIRGLDAARNTSGHATSLLEDALDGPLSPAGEAAAWKALGWVSLSKKNYSEALRCYSRALDAMPGDRQAVDGLARARRKAGPGEWVDEAVSKDDPAPATDWKGMYSQLYTEHEQCKAIRDDHAKLSELAQTITAERDAAVKAHAECGAGSDALKKQVEEKDAEIMGAAEKVASLEAERDELKKLAETGGTDLDGVRKQLEEKDAELKASNEKAMALEAERDELKKLAEAGGTDLEGVRKQLEEKDAELKASSEKVAALEAERDELKKRAEAGGDPESLKKEIEEKDAALQTANEKVAALEAERDELKKRAEEGGDPEGLKKKVEEQDARITELEQQVKDRDESIKKQREEIDRLTEELKKKEGE